tara:strand:+ start:229 stop:936 length:708 start_codon:yes stop_codon:yes gene_type:complete
MEINFKKSNFLVDPINYQNFWNNFSNWEQNDLDFVTQIAEQNKIFIDIGAWIGPYTLIAASMGMKVYAFEPDKVAFQELEKNIKLNSFKHKPEIFNFGLSKIDTKAYLYSNTDNFGKSESGLINYKNQKNTKKTEIELKNFLQEIDKIKNHNSNNRIKVIKIDIEGGEFLFEKDIYELVKLEKIYCIFSYHHMVFNRNKFKKNFYKMRTLFYQIFIKKIYPSKNFFKIANIFKSK